MIELPVNSLALSMSLTSEQLWATSHLLATLPVLDDLRSAGLRLTLLPSLVSRNDGEAALLLASSSKP